MILLDFYFLGLTYIIVYVGAIMILFLFVIMMVQIHLMPLTDKSLSAPRVFRSEIGSTTASQLTSPSLDRRSLRSGSGILRSLVLVVLFL